MKLYASYTVSWADCSQKIWIFPDNIFEVMLKFENFSKTLLFKFLNFSKNPAIHYFQKSPGN